MKPDQALPEKHSILIVEDEQITAMSLEMGLKRLGYESLGCVVSGEEAVDYVCRASSRHKQPDLILMDINLEREMDGLQAAAEIRHRTNIPVIFLSAQADDKTLGRAEEAHAYGFIVKPYNPTSLKPAIEMALYRHRMETQLRRSEQNYATLAENLPDVVMRFNAEGRYLYASPSVRAVLDRTPGELLGKTHREAGLPELDCRFWEERIQAVFKNGEPLEWDMEHSENNRIKVMNWRLIPDYDPNGGMSTVLAIARDESERRKTESELSGYRQELEELVRRRTAELHEEIERHKRSKYLYSMLIRNVPGHEVDQLLTKIAALKREMPEGRAFTGSADAVTERVQTSHAPLSDGSVLLFVDDDAVSVNMIAEKYTTEGYRAVAVHSAVDALGWLEHHAADVVFTDIRMPGMDGIQLMRQIMQAFPDMIVIAMTAHEDIDSVTRCLRAGAFDYIRKPFDYNELGRALTAACHELGLRRSLRRASEQLFDTVENLAGLVRERGDDLDSAMRDLNLEIEARKRVQESLTISQERHQIVSGLISDIVYTHIIQNNGEIKFEWITGACENITGYSREALFALEGGWLSLVHPDDRLRAERYLLRLLKSETSVFEYRILTRDGAVCWLRDYVQPVQDAETGRVVRLVGALQDITERKNTEDLHRVQRDIAFMFNEVADLNQALERLLSILTTVETVDCGAVYVRDAVRDRFLLHAHHGLSQHFLRHGAEIGAHSGQYARAMEGRPIFKEGGDPILVNDWILKPEQLKALTLLPIMHEAQPVAIVFLASRSSEGMAPATRKLLESVTFQLGGVIARRRAEMILEARLRLEEGVAAFSRILLRNSDTGDALEQALHPMLHASGFNRIVVYENQALAARCARIVLTVDAAESNAAPPAFLVDYDTVYPNWRTLLAAGRCAAGLTHELDTPERDALRQQDVHSVVALPLHVGERWYGFIRFDDTRRDLLRGDEDLRLLRTVADLIGAFIERRWLEWTILDISEKEQRRIGRDLHDGLGQHLTGMAFKCALLKQDLQPAMPEAAEVAGELEAMANEAISRAHNLAYGLNPVHLESDGLVLALEKLAATVETVFQVSCTFVCDEEPRFHTSSVANQVYRIAQEALNNAVKHGDADQVVVTLARADEGWRLMIEDDGQGLPSDVESGSGMGLMTMKSRALMIGGSFALRNREGGGVRVVCCFKENAMYSEGNLSERKGKRESD